MRELFFFSFPNSRNPEWILIVLIRCKIKQVVGSQVKDQSNSNHNCKGDKSYLVINPEDEWEEEDPEKSVVGKAD